MALAFRSCDHVSPSGAGPLPSRQEQVQALREKFPAIRPGADAPAIPKPEIFASLHDHDNDSMKAGTPPTAAECAVHLEMLEAFFILKQKVLSSNALDRAFKIAPKDTVQTIRGKRVRKPDSTFAERRKAKWSIYVRLAASRFHDWWKPFDQILASQERSGEGWGVTEKSLPPLDVLMVWHAFILNTATYRHHCLDFGRQRWFDVKFPWKAIHNALRDNNRSFHASSDAERLFDARVGAFDLFSTLADYKSHSQELRLVLAEMVPSSGKKVALEIACPAVRTPPASDTRWSNANMLAEMVERQDKFVEKMAAFLWLRSPGLGGTLRRAITRYERFMQLFRENPQTTLVPTLDIDLVWHTHQCSPTLYAEGCRKLAGRAEPIGHDDRLGQSTLKDGFGVAQRLYEARFRDEYNACLCWECEALKTELAVGDADVDDEVDLEKVATKVQLLVEYHKAAELARRSGETPPALPEELGNA